MFINGFNNTYSDFLCSLFTRSIILRMNVVVWQIISTNEEHTMENENLCKIICQQFWSFFGVFPAGKLTIIYWTEQLILSSYDNQPCSFPVFLSLSSFHMFHPPSRVQINGHWAVYYSWRHGWGSTHLRDFSLATSLLLLLFNRSSPLNHFFVKKTTRLVSFFTRVSIHTIFRHWRSRYKN